MSKLHIKKGDMVYVIAGDNRGQQGKVLSVDAAKNRAIVEGVNICKKGENDYYVQLKPDGTRYGYGFDEGTPAPEGPTHAWEYRYHDNGTVRLAEQKRLDLGNTICTEKYDEYGMLISVRDEKTGNTNTLEYAPLSQAPRVEQ